MNHMENIFSATNFGVSFTSYDKGLRQRQIQAIHQLNLTVHRGEILTVAGASGSGKSLLAHAIFGILPDNASVQGTMYFCNEVLTQNQIRSFRGKKMSFIPQSISCLNPLMKIGKFAGKKACALFERYGLDSSVQKKYPHELSGGMARRVLIACAASTNADFIVADEPTAGLNDKLAHEILRHLRELADEGRAVLLITHDIYLASAYANTFTILQEGKSIETLDVEMLKQGHAKHPFTRALWSSLPENDFFCHQLGETEDEK